MTAHFSLPRFPLYVREGFFWGLPSIYTVSHGSMYPESRRCTQIERVTMRYRSHASQIPATRAFLRKLDGLPFELELAFVRSALFCGSSDFANAKAFRTHLGHPRIHTLRISAASNAPATPMIADHSQRDKVVEPDMRSGFVARLSGRTETAVTECRLFGIEWIWPVGHDRIGLPPGMSLIGNYRIEGPIFGDRGPTQRRCPMDIQCILDTEFWISYCSYSLFDNAILYRIVINKLYTISKLYYPLFRENKNYNASIVFYYTLFSLDKQQGSIKNKSIF